MSGQANFRPFDGPATKLREDEMVLPAALVEKLRSTERRKWPFQLEPDENSFARVLRNQRRDRVIDGALQIAIAVLSIAAAYLVASTGPYQRWGFVVGLASQPFWFIATWRSRQYGVLLVAVFYTGAWVQGILNRFF